MHNLDLLAKKFGEASIRYCQEHNFEKTNDWVLMKLQEEVGELFQAYLMKTGRARNKGQSQAELEDMFACELADVFGMLMVLINETDIDINAYLTKKWKFNPDL